MKTVNVTGVSKMLRKNKIVREVYVPLDEGLVERMVNKLALQADHYLINEYYYQGVKTPHLVSVDVGIDLIKPLIRLTYPWIEDQRDINSYARRARKEINRSYQSLDDEPLEEAVAATIVRVIHAIKFKKTKRDWFKRLLNI